MVHRYQTDPTFRKRLRKKSQQDQASILQSVSQLVEDPSHPGLRTKKLAGTDVFSARSSGGNRITFHWEKDTMVLRNHCNHDEVLRNP
jgi:mRNA interferase RelE/StbE